MSVIHGVTSSDVLTPVLVDSDGGLVSGAGASGTEQRTYSTIAVGELQGSATALQLPSVACKLAKLKALISNVGNVYLGGSGVTVPNGATDVTSGIELAPGDETGWLPISNLNLLYRICDNAGDDLTYLALA